MTPRHHPSDATLFAYGGGTLGEGLALAVATHLAFCRACRRRVGDVEAVGGALLDELPPVAMEADALSRVLARLTDQAPPAPVSAMTTAMPQAFPLPQPLRGYLGAPDGWRWHRLLAGVSQIEILPRMRGGGTARLLRVEPGKALARHGHSGREATIVLSGSFSDQFGRFGPGDFAETEAGDWHQPIAGDDADCVCLIATESPLRFSGVVARIMQPFFRI